MKLAFELIYLHLLGSFKKLSASTPTNISKESPPDKNSLLTLVIIILVSLSSTNQSGNIMTSNVNLRFDYNGIKLIKIMSSTTFELSLNLYK